MLAILRLIFTGGFLYYVLLARSHVRQDPINGDLMNAFDLAVCVILALMASVTWAPVFGDKLSDPMTGIMTEGTFAERRNWMLWLIRLCEKKGLRRLVLFLAFAEGVRRPWTPTPFVIGMRHAGAGSWLQKVFAREVFKFDNTQNCQTACKILESHGIDPRPHTNPSINLTLLSLEKSVAPERETLHLPKAEEPSLQRNERIKLF